MKSRKPSNLMSAHDYLLMRTWELPSSCQTVREPPWLWRKGFNMASLSRTSMKSRKPGQLDVCT